jgi:CheY-like chemotaxis protein
MHMQSLLLSKDVEVSRILRPALEKLSIDMEVCHNARSGNEVLCAEKFDAVIVDCDDLQDGLDVLRGLRKTPSNRSSVAFALLNGVTTTQQAFEWGANFVLQKPISPLNAMRCFSAAVGLMTRERRRYFRHPANIAVKVMFEGEQVEAKGTNLSEGGMAILFEGPVPKTGSLRLSFQLPGSGPTVELTGQLAWMDGLGRAGVRFVEMPPASRQRLDLWLGEQMDSLDQSST